MSSASSSSSSPPAPCCTAGSLRPVALLPPAPEAPAAPDAFSHSGLLQSGTDGGGMAKPLLRLLALPGSGGRFSEPPAPEPEPVPAPAPPLPLLSDGDDRRKADMDCWPGGRAFFALPGLPLAALPGGDSNPDRPPPLPPAAPALPSCCLEDCPASGGRDGGDMRVGALSGRMPAGGPALRFDTRCGGGAGAMLSGL